MYYTYVVRPGQAVEGRGPQFQPFWDTLMNYNLRGGFLLQFIGYQLVVIGALFGGNVLTIFHVISGKQNTLEYVPIPVTFLGSLCLILGSLWVQNFRSIADDDASIRQSRGYRTGMKLLQQASLLDLISWSLTCILFFSLMHYFDDIWTLNHSGSGTNVIFGLLTRSLHALSCILYGLSLFFLESFHTQGTGDAWGLIIGVLYEISGFFEFLMLFDSSFLASLWDFLFTFSFGLALFCSLVWALSFEALVTDTDVKLTQSAMRIEFYKSKNAVAYYGPPITTELSTDLAPTIRV